MIAEIPENSILSDRVHNASVHRQGNETRATLGQNGQEEFAKWQQAALHSDTLTSLKYIKYWVA